MIYLATFSSRYKVLGFLARPVFVRISAKRLFHVYTDIELSIATNASDNVNDDATHSSD